MASFNKSGAYIVTAMENGSAQIWSVGNGQLMANLQHEPSSGSRRVVNTAFFDPATTRVVTAGENGKVILWYIREKLPLQEDRSDNLWSIVRPHLAAKDINMGKVVVGTAKDSTAQALTNPDPYPVTVTRVWFKNPNGPFSIISGGAPFTVTSASTPTQPGAYNIEFHFAPLTLGRQSDIVFYQTIAGDTVQAVIEGVGIDSSIIVSGSVIDWRERFINLPYDTVQAVVFNRGTVPVTFNPPTTIGGGGGFTDPMFEFRGFKRTWNDIMNSKSPYTVQPGDSIIINARFYPKKVGRFSSLLQFTFSEPNSPVIVQLFGTGIQDGPLLSSDITVPPVVQGVKACDPPTFSVPLPNTGTTSLSITGAEIVGSNGAPSRDFAIVGSSTQTVAANDVGNLTVRFTPQTIGTTSATLVVRSNSVLGETVRIALQGRLERPQVIFSQRLVVFPAVNAGDTASVTVAVTNRGNADAPWFPPSIIYNDERGTPRLRITADPATANLAPNTTGRLTLTFLGGTAGMTYANTVKIIDPNACYEDSIFWSATVKSAPLLLTTRPDPLITCASSATFTIAVSNVGTALGTVSYAIEPPTPIARLVNIPARIATRETITVQVRMDTLARADTTRFNVVIREATTGTVISVLISVVKRDVGLEISPLAVSFPGLDADVSTSAVITIRNRSSQTLTLPQVPLGRTPQFRLEAPLTLAPYGIATMRVVFTGAAAGLDFADGADFSPIAVASNDGSCPVSPQRITMSASTTPLSTADLVFTNFSASPGDIAFTKVYLRNRARIALGTIITDTLRYNLSLLQPLAPLPFGTVASGERSVPVRFEVKSADESVPLDSLGFRAALGNDTATVLRLLKTPETRAVKAVISASTATFRLTGIARAGGLRLIISSMGTLRILDAHPNPASSELTLEFFSADAEDYLLYLINPIGARPDPAAFPEQRFTSVRGVNVRVLDVSRLPSGTYFLQLRNGRELAARRIVIVR